MLAAVSGEVTPSARDLPDARLTPGAIASGAGMRPDRNFAPLVAREGRPGTRMLSLAARPASKLRGGSFDPIVRGRRRH
jgi:hypothetical protein